MDEVTAFLASSSETFDDFVRANGLSAKPVIALLAGSRKQEIKDNLPDMLRAAASFLIINWCWLMLRVFPPSITNVMWVGWT